jgi:D-alanyl-lipoteichoic acid acyltransferase DltB (MBOAT superfamily)
MLFPTVDFAIFFVAVFAIAWAIRPWHLWWRVFLVAASWFFYGFWEPPFVLLLVGSTAANWAIGYDLARMKGADGALNPAGRALLTFGIALNLLSLGYFKYYGFFAQELNDVFGVVGAGNLIPLREITLPVAISFFTFHAISYLVDISRGDIEEPMSILDFSLYLGFFPHLVAGPIVRVTEFLPQIREPLSQRLVDATPAFQLILFGLFKKVVISSYLASEIADPVFAAPGQHSAQEIIIGVYAYAIQIFADFSGYTDIAIGCAMLLGVKFPQNFAQPYRSLSLQDFWRRWHMTLSRWLRDYLYIPLGGNRGAKSFVYRNLALTMILGGLWHGAALTFVFWGAIHGFGLVIERELRERYPGALGRFAPVLQWLITFHVVCLAWIFFRAETFGTAWEMIGRMLTAWGDTDAITPLLLLVIAGSLAAQFLPDRLSERLQVSFTRLAPVAQAATLAVALVAIDVLGPEGVSPFIYFQF